MLQRLIAALRQIGEGVMHNTYGSCSGDPIAWEHDFLRRQREEREAAATANVAARTVVPESADPSSTPSSRSGKIAALSIALVLLGGSAAFAQRWLFSGGYPREPRVSNRPYDGRFTFTRLKYTTAPGGDWYQGLASWAHGYPLSEDNLMRIMNEISGLNAHVDGFNVFSLDDEELCKYPLAYITEAGWWQMNDSEMKAFRNYLRKGGFVIFDDFKVENQFGFGGGWGPFEANIQRLFPGTRFFELDLSHPIFHSFFEIKTLDNFPQAYNSGRPVFRAVFEDNDPKKRVMMVINYNTDISQYWEWSGRGLRPFDETNEAYKLGVNYIVYGLTH